ncbi:MAG: type II toxin-antitoxin system MqsR family toxin [Deltaproteobacteria bacterium]|nr:type II toxin-antitoxin system MqsR family toxin [Deltaproteobacteria bacterium]
MLRRPTHELAAFQAAMAARLRATRTAVESAQVLGFSADGIKATLASMRPSMFYKSMPSELRPGQWQDVYHVPSVVGILYVKFTDEGIQEFKLLSFKAK